MRILLPFLVTLFVDEEDLAPFRGRGASAARVPEGKAQLLAQEQIGRER